MAAFTLGVPRVLKSQPLVITASATWLVETSYESMQHLAGNDCTGLKWEHISSLKMTGGISLTLFGADFNLGVPVFMCL
jgi:hypothetical protein